MKNVVLGVTGGIAAYKSCEIVSRLKKAGFGVAVVMTENACKFVSPITFETLSQNRVYTDQFDRAFEIGHITLAKFADLTVVAPATGNIIGKFANGIADDLLSTSLMAAVSPVAIAPAMNCQMWRSAANQRNIDILKSRGIDFIGPEKGKLACGDDDIGRMSEPSAIVDYIIAKLGKSRDFDGKRVLVTAGPTREMIDPVRFLSNRSTGRMGYCIAEAARDRGGKVTLLSGSVSLEKPRDVEIIDFTSTRNLYDIATRIAPNFDVVIQAAAPADFTIEQTALHKIKKTGDDMTLRLVSTPDIAKALGEKKRPGQVLVAFAAETDDVEENAAKKLVKKNADLIVANDVSQPDAGFAVGTNRVTIIDAESAKPYPLMSKREVADVILDRVAAILVDK